MMSRRPNTSRRPAESGDVPFMGAFNPKSRPSPMLSIGLFIVGAFLIVGYIIKGSGGRDDIAALSRLDGGVSCTLEVTRLLPFLKKAYGDSMRKVLHVGPETCSVVSQLLKEEDTEAWGVEPYELDDADGNCRSLIHKGIVRVADIKFPLPYRPKSFSLVIVSDALDYLSPKYLNKTVPELARVASDGLVILSGYPGQQRVKVAELSKFGRPAYFSIGGILSFGPEARNSWLEKHLAQASQIPKLVLVDKVVHSDQFRRERNCYQEVSAGSNQEIYRALLPNFPPKTIVLSLL